MGYDIYGLAAKSEKGDYFRNNIWWWNKLWEFTSMVGERKQILTQNDIEGGWSNSGHKISEKKTKQLCIWLKQAVTDGEALAFQKNIEKKIRNARLRNINKKQGDKGYNWTDAYPFTVENLNEWIEFLEESGGFQIL